MIQTTLDWDGDCTPKELLFKRMEVYGYTYDPIRDYDRLRKNVGRVFAVMCDGEWHTIQDLKPVGGLAWDSRVRSLRNDQFGNMRVESVCVEGGLWKYRLDLDSVIPSVAYALLTGGPLPNLPKHDTKRCPLCNGSGRVLRTSAEDESAPYGEA